MTTPEKIPNWASDPALTTADVLEPPDAQRVTGWVLAQPVLREWWNWMARTVGEWIGHLKTAPTTYASIEEVMADIHLEREQLALVDHAEPILRSVWSIVAASLGGDPPETICCDGLRVFVATGDHLYAFSAADGTPLWDTATDSRHIACDGLHVYAVGVGGATIVALDPEDGTQDTFVNLVEFVSAITADRGQVYASFLSGNVRAYKATSLVENWANTSDLTGKTVRSIASNGDEVVCAVDGAVQAISLAVLNGTARNDWSVDGDGRDVTVDAHGRFILGTTEGLYLASGGASPLLSWIRQISMDDTAIMPADTGARKVACSGGHIAVATNDPGGGTDWCQLSPTPGGSITLGTALWGDGGGDESYVVGLDPLRLFLGSEAGKQEGTIVLSAWHLPRQSVMLRKSHLSKLANLPFVGVIEEA